MNGLTARLLNAVVNGAKPDVNLDLLLTHAGKNKILLHLLRALNIQGSIRERQESGIGRVVEVVRILSKLLKNYDYAFFKLIKPISYVPADVDLLVDARQARNIVHEVTRLGYTIAVKDPYCITLTKDDSIIDLYVHPSLGGAIFIDGQKLLEYSCTTEFDGAEIKSLERYVEALATASHAVYKERIYTLNDYFTVERWASKKTIKLAQELECEEALKTAINLNKQIRMGILETPYKIPLPTWLTIITRKLRADSLTRATSMNILKTLTDKRIGRLLTSKLTRETY
jgi:hypothetical protein